MCVAILWSLCPSKIHLPSQIFSISNYMLWSQKLKIYSKLSERNCEEIFFSKNVCFLIWSIKWRCKQTNKKKTFFVTKIFFEGCLCRKCKPYPESSFVLLSFYGELLVIYQFSSNFACSYLGASHFGRPSVFRK